eukprot:CAMPEP_0170653912 /NCGR_PEP_ID=MMETSP0224-20130122/47651_1 /TAXON_ID=285029 /ORGANISM="Togula jolla, Strain CCCM 725" /LENGTH=369 /DNA_ID=CAMNT_0010985797 /DNA_START=23 /DNA_END=1132 /DNA_ORIENTATION=-
MAQSPPWMGGMPMMNMSMPISRKRGIFAEPDPYARSMAAQNPEYQYAFQMFDRDRSGSIDVMELSDALSAVEKGVEANTMRGMFPHYFNPHTVMWLSARFAASGGGVIHLQQFAEMMQYLESLKSIFAQIDTDRTGDLSVQELSRALSISGFSVSGVYGGGDALSLAVAEQIGRSYDFDGNGVLTFDEFVQLRLEWDCYLDAWQEHVPMGSDNIAPQQLLHVLEGIKHSMEPISAMAYHPSMSNLNGFSPMSSLGGLLYASMFNINRPFSPRTAQLLIARFGSGMQQYMNFEQFCMMMEWIKEQKKKFVSADLDRTGKINLSELATAFACSGMPMSPAGLIELARRYDQDGSGCLEFDEFLQMMVEMSN